MIGLPVVTLLQNMLTERGLGICNFGVPYVKKMPESLDMAEQTRPRPYKVCNSERTKTTGIVATSLEELKDKAGSKLGIACTPASCRVFLERDGTEVDDEEYFDFLEDQTKFMIVSNGEEWTLGSQSVSCSQGSVGSFAASLEKNESMEFDRIDAGENVENNNHSNLLIRIKNDPAFFISFSDEDLQEVIKFDCNQFATDLGKSVIEAEHSQEACQQELDRRREFRDATQLLLLLKRAQEHPGSENEESVGNKRRRTGTQTQ